MGYVVSFGMTTQADAKLIGGHYSEQASMKLRGSIRYPEGFKYPTLECCLYVDLLLLDGKAAPSCIGSMQTSGKRLVAYVAIHTSDSTIYWSLQSVSLRWRSIQSH